MRQHSCPELVRRARDGDTGARELLVDTSRNFILKTASRSCRRYLDWSNDDELSIAMIAFNEAIDSYDFSRATGFYGYARMVIQRRLVDHFRKEIKHASVLLEDEKNIFLENRISLDGYLKEQESVERKQEIEALARELKTYGIPFSLLVKKCPRHRDTREKLFRAAEVLANNPLLFDYLKDKKRLPQKRLSEETGYSVKFLERGRVYIISMAVVMKHPELVYMRSYIDYSPDKGRDKNETKKQTEGNGS